MGAAALLGCNDSNLSHAVKAVNNFCDTDPKYANQFNKLCEALGVPKNWRKAA